jgi:hypothetical protein
MPGEAFPEIRAAIAPSVHGADLVVGLSKAQDDLGYFFPEWVFPFTFLYPSDHWQFNVSTQVGDHIVSDQLSNVSTLGFATDPPSSSHLLTDWLQAFNPGLQALASPMQGSVGDDGVLPVALQAIYDPAAFGGHEIAGMVQWNFGDGTTEITPPEAIFTHAFPPGQHLVSLKATDTTGKVANWSLTVNVYPQLSVQAEARPSGGGDVTFTGRVQGGQGTVLAWRWTFNDGGSASGQMVTHRFPVGVQATGILTVTDGSGATETATVNVTE